MMTDLDLFHDGQEPPAAVFLQLRKCKGCL